MKILYSGMAITLKFSRHIPHQPRKVPTQWRTTMTTRINALTEFLADKGMKASAWKNRRVYLNGYGRDIKACIVLDDPLDTYNPDDETDSLYSGCSLKVYSNCEQGRKWLINRAKQVKHNIMCEMATIGEADDNLFGSSGTKVCDDWRDIIL
jgi:hypothetical protein